MSYTALAVLGVGLAVLLDIGVLRTGLVRRRVFWTAYAIVLAFQLLANGWLTGRDIVTYSDSAILGTRLVFAPVEDLLFGFSLVLQTLSWWVWWGRRAARSGPGAAGGAQRGQADRQPAGE